MIRGKKELPEQFIPKLREIEVEVGRGETVLVTRYQKSAPGLAGWLEANVPEAITVFGFLPGHRRRLRTNNGLERLHREIKRRTRVATLFPNEASLLRLVSAVLSEISDDWETEWSHLDKEVR